MSEKKDNNFSITDLDKTGLVKERSGNLLGDAHEHLVVAILMRLGFEVALAEVSASTYDCIISGFRTPKNADEKSKKIFLKAQIKTASGSVPLKGGGRGGVDRIYNTEETEDKTYKYTTNMVDIIIGVDRDNLDLYILPTKYAEEWGSSKALSKLQPLKNNWDILLNWNDKYLEELKYKLPDFKEK